MIDLFLVPSSNPGQGIYDTSQDLGGVIDRGLAIVDWVQRDPLVGAPSVFGPILFLGWLVRRAFGRSGGDWTTRG